MDAPNDPQNTTTRTTRWSREAVLEKLIEFLDDTTDLREKSWKAWFAGHGAPSSGAVTAHVGGSNFSEVITAQALTHRPSKRYIWPTCSEGRQHRGGEYWEGSGEERGVVPCVLCRRDAEQRAVRARENAERLASLPTFAERYPHLVRFLANPADADSRGVLVAFRCSSCDLAPVRWSPSRESVPLCTHCLQANGQPPGSLVPRKGGGEVVSLEAAVADELAALGLAVTHEHGIVVPPRRYYVGVIKPDIVVLDPCVAIELDQSDSAYNQHLTPDGAADDQARDLLLEEVGWRVLRIRRPDAPVSGPWPWRIDSTSTAPRKLARVIVEALGRSSAAG